VTAVNAGQARVFAALHRRGEPFVLPNAWDVASAVLIAGAGFPAIGTTSMGVNAAAGQIDGQGTGRAYTMALAAAIAPRVPVPVTVDFEGGFSDDPAEVADLAAELASLGVAGINLEDATAGGSLRHPAAQARIIEAIRTAAPDLFVNARTDVYWLECGPAAGRLTETLNRLAAYAGAGAHGVFVPGVTDLSDIETVTAQIALPLNVLWRPGLDQRRLAAAGVARISTGSGPYRRALAAGLATAVAARDGTAPPPADITYADLTHVLAASYSTPRSSA
jgi:2-methylisocitrate lyase-like PEP mutase family enzyme